MLDEIKAFYDFPTDADFAKHLGITPQVLSNWRNRNSFDAELLYKKCPDLNPSWLLCGEVPMVNPQNKYDSMIKEGRSPYILRKKINYLEREIKVLSKADKIMNESGNQIKQAIKLLSEQLQSIEEDLQNILKEKK